LCFEGPAQDLLIDWVWWWGMSRLLLWCADPLLDAGWVSHVMWSPAHLCEAVHSLASQVRHESLCNSFLSRGSLWGVRAGPLCSGNASPSLGFLQPEAHSGEEQISFFRTPLKYLDSPLMSSGSQCRKICPDLRVVSYKGGQSWRGR
jgi:hypothetical protein